MKRGNIALAATFAVVLVGAASYFGFTLLGTPAVSSTSEGGNSAEMAVASQPGATVNGPSEEEPEGSGETGAETGTEGDAETETETTASGGGMIQATLYVLGSSGLRLTTEKHEIPLESSVQSQATEVMRLLLRRSAAIPSGVQLRQVFVTSQGVAYVDLSREVVSNHPGGSSAEELTIYGISNTLIANFPAIQSVRILVEASEVQTLAGHLDLTVAYGRAPAYLRPLSENSESLDEAS